MGGEGDEQLLPGVPYLIFSPCHTVRKMDLILRSIEQSLQIQFSMARTFLLPPIMQILHLQYDVKPCEKTAQT